MDRFAEQLFGMGSKDGSSRSGGTDPMALTGTILRGLAKSAAKRAVEIHDTSGSRSHGGGFSSEDFHTLGGLVVEMMNGRMSTTEKSSERRRKKHRRRRHRESEQQERDIKVESGQGEEEAYVPKYSKRRRRSSGSPLHVTFAEPLEDFDYPPPRTHRRRHNRPEEEYQYQPESRYESRHSSRRSHERRSRRRRQKIALQSLKTELEDMSSTIISLNARSANHRDCEFYDKFVRKGGKLQDVIGNTLGQIRGWEEERGYGYSYDGERRERKRRRRERERRY